MMKGLIHIHSNWSSLIVSVKKEPSLFLPARHSKSALTVHFLYYFRFIFAVKLMQNQA